MDPDDFLCFAEKGDDQPGVRLVLDGSESAEFSLISCGEAHGSTDTAHGGVTNRFLDDFVYISEYVCFSGIQVR